MDDHERDQDVWLDPLTRGSVMHDLFAQLMRRARDAGRRLAIDADLPWSLDLGRAELLRLDTEMPSPSREVFEREQQEVLDDIDLFVRTEADADPSRTPLAFEVSFGRPDDGEEPLAQPDPIVIDLGHGLRFRLAGRIDRIDQIGPSSFEIIDYKTGGYWDNDWQGTFGGGQMLQHALYGLAAVQILKRRVAHPRVTDGVYSFPCVKGRQEEKRIPAPSLAAVTAVLDDLRAVIATGLFVHAPEKDPCKWCDFGHACGGSAGPRATQKIDSDAALAPYGKLVAHE